MDLNVRAYCGFELKDMHTLMSEWVEGYLAGFAYRVCVEPTEICLNCGQAYARAGVAAKKAKKKKAALARKDVQRKLVEEESEDPAVFVHWASRRRKG